VSNDFVSEDLLLRNDIDVNTGNIANATHLPTHDTIVKRDNNGTTGFHDITTNYLSVTEGMGLYGEASLQYVPQDDQTPPQNVMGYTYRFGHPGGIHIDEPGYFGAGLEMKDILENHLLMQVNKKTPHINIQVNKNAGIPYVLIRDSDDIPEIEINAEGFAQRYHIYPIQTFTPGQKLSLVMRDGPQTHVLELGIGWTADTSETIVEFKLTGSAGDYRVIENLEVCLDDRAQPIPVGDLYARITIKRWGVYRNNFQTLYMVLGIDFDPNANEVEVEMNSFLRISFNNKKVLS
jgi:hypothetical protein